MAWPVRALSTPPYWPSSASADAPSLKGRRSGQTYLGGFFLTELVQVIDNRGRTLTPCRRKVAEKEVRLNRAKWVGPNKIRLRFDPFAYRYIRLKVLVRDGYTCYWCGGPGDTMDHIVPWSKGGRTTMDNCICACQECNGRRGDMPAPEFARLRGVVPPGAGGRPIGQQRHEAALPLPKAANDTPITRPLALSDLLDPFLRPLSRQVFY